MPPKLGDPVLLSQSLGGFASAASAVGRFDQSLQLYEEVIALSRAIGDRRGLAIDLGNLAVTKARQGDLDGARALMTESLEMSQEEGDMQGVVYTVINRGQVLLAQQHWTAAVRDLHDGLQLAARMKLREGIVGEALLGLGTVAAAAGDHLWAARLFGAAEAFAASIGAFLDQVLPDTLAAAVAATREQLGDEAYAAAHGAGAALSFEDAVAEALAVTVDPASVASTPSCPKG